ncbi:MAG: peptidoglycan editing factor PgeF [Ruminococcaceae bacterium]|nr:peptidoglycan editing factor PgeF [Oscillospiraceae bacterium]
MYIKSNILRSPHAFSTRQGGVSRHSHTSSLNLAFSRGDDDETVLQNLAIFSKEVGFDKESIVSFPQIHSDRIFTVSHLDCGKGYYFRDDLEGGDGYVTNERGVTLGIKTADCVPILFEAEKAGSVVAIGAVHAGWRGTVSKIATKCVDRMVCEFDLDKKHIRASIGPCIHKCCYEVGSDLYDAVCRDLGEQLALRYVVPSSTASGKYKCDLAGLNRELLLDCGLEDGNVELVSECTCCQPQKFFSHRYSGGVRGTMLSVIFIK